MTFNLLRKKFLSYLQKEDPNNVVKMLRRSKAEVILMAAIGARTRALGKNNDLIWKIPHDLKRFRFYTGRYPLIMGRKTFASLGNKPLKGFFPSRRRNFIVTRDKEFRTNAGTVCYSVEDALQKALQKEKIVYVIGGAQIYQHALPYATKLRLTLVDSYEEGDVFFPPYEEEFTKKVFEEEHEWDGLKYKFVDLER